MSRLLLCLAVLICTNVSAQWSLLSPDTEEDLHSVCLRPNGNIWIGGFDTLQWSADNGDTFIERPTMIFGNAPIFGLYLAVHAFNNNEALITGVLNLGEAETIYRTSNGGVTWDQVHYANFGPVDVLRDLEFAEAPLGFAVGDNGRILRSTNAGLAWTPVASGTIWSLERVVWAGGDVYLAGGSSAFIRSTDNGLSWTTVPGFSGITNVSCVGNVCHAAVGANMMRSIDAGATWGISGTAVGSVMEMLDGTTLIMANDTGMFRSATSGQYWERLVVPNYQPVIQIDFHDAATGVAVGESGYAIRTANAGGAALPVARIIPPAGSVCVGSTVVFENPGDPAYDYTWRIDGAIVSNAMQLSTAFATAGPHLVQLEADNGNGTNTASLSITILQEPTVLPFTAVAASDTICVNGTTTISIPASEVGTVYRLYRGEAIQGNPLNGGVALSFPTGAVTTPTNFTVKAIRTNACGSDTLGVDVMVWVPYVPVANSWSFTEAEGCAPHIPVVRILNSTPGFEYRVNSAPAIEGTGGTLDVPMPMVNSNATVTATVYVNYSGSFCAGQVLQTPQSIQVYQVDNGFYIDQDPGNDPSIAIVGQPRTVVFTENPALTYAWDFGEGAVPADHQGGTPPSFSFTSPGTKQVVLTTVSPLGLCSATDTATIMVVDSAEFAALEICTTGFAGLDAHISDMCLDAHNNRYVTGFRRTGGNGGEVAFFAMKLDSLGQMIWRYLGPSSGNWQSHGSYGYGIAADKAGNSYVTGRFDHDIRTIDGVSIFQPNFLVKFDRQGALEWQLTSMTNKFKGIVCTEDDVLHVVGYDSWSGIDLFLPSGARSLTTLPANDPQRGNMFMLELNADGEVLNQRMFGYAHTLAAPNVLQSMSFNSGGLDTEARFRCDPILRHAPDGGLLIAGVVQTIPDQSLFEFGGSTMQSHVPPAGTWNTRQVYLLRYTPQAGITDAYGWVGGRPQTVQGVSQAPNGQFVVCGRYNSPFLFNGDQVEWEIPTTSNPRHFSYLVSANAEGEPLWYGASPSKETFVNDVHFIADGSFYALVGYSATGLLPTANNGFIGAGSNDAYLDNAVAHYAADGTLMSIAPSSSSSGVAFNLRPDVCGNLHVAALTADAGGTVEHPVVTCNGCEQNLYTLVIAAADCASGCFAANVPDYRDVALESIMLSDQVSNAPIARVSFRNMGQVQVDQVIIGYRINEGPVQTVTWNGVLNYGQQIDALDITSLSFVNRHSNRITAWVDRVNGSMDDLRANDTLYLAHGLCPEPLHGTYSCGSDGADFRSFGQATKALSECGISAPTTIAISDGDHYEQLRIAPIPGTSSADTVVFTSASGDSASVRLHFMPGTQAAYNAVITLDDSCHFVSIADLTLMHTTPGSLSYGIQLGLRNEDVHVLRNHVIGLPTVGLACVFSRPGMRRFHIEANRLDFGSYGITCLGVPNSTVYFDTQVSIIDNTLVDQTNRGVYTFPYDVLLMKGNTILSSAEINGPNYRAMYVWAPLYRIENNYIRVATLEPVDQDEAIFGLVQVYSSVMGTMRSSITNNMIFNPLATGPNVIPTFRLQSKNVDLSHNTFGGITQIHWTDDLAFRNNIFYNSTATFALDFDLDVEPSMVSDNNLFSTGPTGGYPAIIRYQGVGRSLGQWNTQTALDLASTQSFANFVSADDLHLEWGANAFFCPTHPEVPRDIDGDTRGLIITRQGADEGDVNVGLREEPHMEMSIWPDPCNGHFNVALDRPIGADVKLSMVDAGGRVVHEERVMNVSGIIDVHVNVAPGLYTVVLSSATDGAVMRPLVVLPN